MKTIVSMLFAAVLLAGCASLQNAGTAEYSIKPFIVDAETGAVACCEVSVKNGKEIASLEAHITKQGDNYTVDLKEKGVSAFRGQEISSAALASAVESAVKAIAIPYAAPALGNGIQLLK